MSKALLIASVAVLTTLAGIETNKIVNRTLGKVKTTLDQTVQSKKWIKP